MDENARLDTTVPGGAYEDAAGNPIDANGQPIKGAALKAAEKQQDAAADALAAQDAALKQQVADARAVTTKTATKTTTKRK